MEKRPLTTNIPEQLRQTTKQADTNTRDFAVNQTSDTENVTRAPANKTTISDGVDHTFRNMVQHNRRDHAIDAFSSIHNTIDPAQGRYQQSSDIPSQTTSSQAFTDTHPTIQADTETPLITGYPPDFHSQETTKQRDAEPSVRREHPATQAYNHFTRFQTRIALIQTYERVEQKQQILLAKSEKMPEISQRNEREKPSHMKEKVIGELQQEIAPFVASLKLLGENTQHILSRSTGDMPLLPIFKNHELLQNAITQLSSIAYLHHRDTQFETHFHDVERLHGENQQSIDRIARNILENQTDTHIMRSATQIKDQYIHDLHAIEPSATVSYIDLARFSHVTEFMRQTLDIQNLRKQEMLWLRTHCASVSVDDIDRKFIQINNTDQQLRKMNREMQYESKQYIPKWADQLYKQFKKDDPELAKELQLISDNIARLLEANTVPAFPDKPDTRPLPELTAYWNHVGQAITDITDQGWHIRKQEKVTAHYQTQKDEIGELQRKIDTGAKKLVRWYEIHAETQIANHIINLHDDYHAQQEHTLEDLHTFYARSRKISTTLYPYHNASSWFAFHLPHTIPMLATIFQAGDVIRNIKATITTDMPDAINRFHKNLQTQESALSKQLAADTTFEENFHTRASLLKDYKLLADTFAEFGRRFQSDTLDVSISPDKIADRLQEHQKEHIDASIDAIETSFKQINPLRKQTRSLLTDLEQLEQFMHNSDQDSSSSSDQDNDEHYKDIKGLNQHADVLINLSYFPSARVTDLKDYEEQRQNNIAISMHADRLLNLISSEEMDAAIDFPYTQLDRCLHRFNKQNDSIKTRLQDMKKNLRTSINGLYATLQNLERWLDLPSPKLGEKLKTRLFLTGAYTLLSDTLTMFGPIIEADRLSITTNKAETQRTEHEARFKESIQHELQTSIDAITVLAKHSRKALEVHQQLHQDILKEDAALTIGGEIWSETYNSVNFKDHQQSIQKAEDLHLIISKYRHHKIIQDDYNKHARILEEARLLDQRFNQLSATLGISSPKNHLTPEEKPRRNRT